MPALPLIWAFASKLPWKWIGGAAILIGLVLWINGMRSDIASLREQNTTLSQSLANETQARQRDVAGLTALSKGLAQVSTDNAKDAKVLSETIDAAHPTPASPQLSAFLDGLRASDSAKPASATR